MGVWVGRCVCVDGCCRVKNKPRKLVGQYVQPIQYMVGHS